MKEPTKLPKPPVPVATDVALHVAQKDGRHILLSYWDVWYVLLAKDEFGGELNNLGHQLREMRKLPSDEDGDDWGSSSSYGWVPA